MSKSRFHVTDHAVLRYLQRVQGVDVEAVRRAMRKTVHNVAEDHPGANGVIADGFLYRIRGDAVVTVMPHNQQDLRTGGKGRKGCRDD